MQLNQEETSYPSTGEEPLRRTGGFDRRRSGARDARYDAIVQMLRDREEEDRQAREKRQRWYRQSLQSDPDVGSSVSSPWSPSRLYKFRTKVPCLATPDARAVLEDLRKRFPGGLVTFPRNASGQQAIMLTRRTGAEPKQIGWVEQCVEADPTRCNVSNQGLSVETDGGTMLVLRFRYPATAVRMSSKHSAAEGATCVSFTEIRPALDLRPPDESSSPRLAWITRPELETINALRSRDYEAFYVRFKLEVMAGIWSSLSGLLSSLPASHWHQGSHYTLFREPDATNRRIRQRTVDDNGRAVDIGADRTYDAASATDILLLYLEGDILADFADIYFTLQSLSSADACLPKEAFFADIRRFWESSESLTSRYGSDFAAVVRMSQRAVPMPAQAPLLKQDWTNLRQALVDRYGKGGRKTTELVGHDLHQPRIESGAWPFASFPAGEVNVGLRLVYRQEWRPNGQTTIDQALATTHMAQVVDEAVEATVAAMRWSRDADGGINIGARGLAAQTDMGLETECRESSRDTTARLSDIMRRTGYEVLTRPAEIQNVVLVAERLPTPLDIDLAWVRRHDWILAKVLLDESFRDALDTIGQESRSFDAKRDRLYEHLRANILHYQRAIWQQEDPQQRSMRYRNSGKKVPVDWRFELESEGALTIDTLVDRLAAQNVDGQFATYSSGREAELDQLIDHSGPLGFYGNYAVYHMRAEFGGADLFSMLHFFKSPYLRAHPETGAPVVEDPEQIQIAEEAAVAAADIQVVDVIPGDVPAELEDRDGEIGPVEAPEAYQLILDTGDGDGLLSVKGQLAPNDDWAILQRDAELHAGAGAPQQRDREAERMIVVYDDRKVSLSRAARAGAAGTHEHVILSRDEEAWAPSLHAGRARDPESERASVAREDLALRFTAVDGVGTPRTDERAILTSVDGDGTTRLRAGWDHDREAQRVILGRDDGVRLTMRTGSGATDAHERVILAQDDEWLRPSLVAE